MQDILLKEVQHVKEIPVFHPGLLTQQLYEAAINAGEERGGMLPG